MVFPFSGLERPLASHSKTPLEARSVRAIPRASPAQLLPVWRVGAGLRGCGGVMGDKSRPHSGRRGQPLGGWWHGHALDPAGTACVAAPDPADRVSCLLRPFLLTACVLGKLDTPRVVCATCCVCCVCSVLCDEWHRACCVPGIVRAERTVPVLQNEIRDVRLSRSRPKASTSISHCLFPPHGHRSRSLLPGPGMPPGWPTSSAGTSVEGDEVSLLSQGCFLLGRAEDRLVRADSSG